MWGSTKFISDITEVSHNVVGVIRAGILDVAENIFDVAEVICDVGDVIPDLAEFILYL